METKDHYALSKLLARRMFLDKPKTFAFILGNVLPDFNLFSYLGGANAADLQGHSYDSRRHLMDQAYSSGFRNTFTGWFRAGEMMHYLADSFTRPHNKEFHYSLKEHIKYERRLHLVFSNYLRTDQVSRRIKSDSGICGFEPWLKNLHRQYIRSTSTPGNDCRYILHSALIVCKGLAQKNEFLSGRYHTVNPLL